MKQALTADRLRERLSYDPETGIFVTKFARGSRPIGTQTGSDHGNGYLAITIDGCWYYAHRLAWLYVHGKWPSKGTDHINRDRADNRISNLREADQSENNMNGHTRPNPNKRRGIYLHKASGLWHVRVSRKRRIKSIGYFHTKEEAQEAYNRAAVIEYGEFARIG